MLAESPITKDNSMIKIILCLLFSALLYSQEYKSGEVANQRAGTAIVLKTADGANLQNNNILAALPNGTPVIISEYVDWNGIPKFFALIAFPGDQGKWVAGYIATENLKNIKVTQVQSENSNK
jgi:hypothetical protein